MDSGLTQPEVAQRLADGGTACTKQAVSSWERGLNWPSPAIVKRLCRLYGCSADALLWDSAREAPASVLLLESAYAAKLGRLQPEQIEHIRPQLELAIDSFHLQSTTATATPSKLRRTGTE